MPHHARLAGATLALILCGIPQGYAAPEPSGPVPIETAGPNAVSAKAWVTGSWSATMAPPEGVEDEPIKLMMTFAPDGALTIYMIEDDDTETGVWLVTAATPGTMTLLLDEDELDADASDDVYLDIAMTGPDAGDGMVRPPADAPPLKIVLVRSAGAAKAPAAGAPVAFADSEPGSVAGVLDALRTFGVPDDARLGIAASDLDGDGAEEALVKVTQMTWCSGNLETCRVWILKRNTKGGWESLGYPYAKDVTLLDTSTNGYRDLAFDSVIYVKGEYGGYAPKE
jgi:hypothetical protein